MNKFKFALFVILLFLTIHSSCNNKKNQIVGKKADSLNNARENVTDAEKLKSSTSVDEQKNQKNNPILSKINTKLDTALVFGIWTIDPNGPHAEFVLSKKSYYIVDYDGDADIPYELKDNILKIHFKENTMEGEVVYVGKDNLKIIWSNNADTTKYKRWKK